MQTPRQELAASGFLSAGMEESSAVEALAEVAGASESVDVRPALAGGGNSIVPSRCREVSG